MYKNKYLKYKIKYLKLKNQFGGKPFDKNNFLTIDEFIHWYNGQKYNSQEYNSQEYNDENIKLNNSFQILRDQIIHFPIGSINGVNETPLNILVGCTNSNNNDYSRFKNSDFYSLFIDLSIDEELEPIKQYNMYTIFFEDLITELDTIAPNIVSNIHFEMFVSYFCSTEKYLKIANHLLIKGGKFIFNYGMQHFSIRLEYLGNNNYIGGDNKIVSLDELENKFNIIIDNTNKQIIYTNKYFINNFLDPQKKNNYY